MDEEQYFDWLSQRFTGNTPRSRLANCRRVEEYEGDLDQHFAKDQGRSLIEKLSYSREDQRSDIPAKHNIPISGDVYNGTATLRHAVGLYFQFISGEKPKDKRSSRKRSSRKKKADWPEWQIPTDDELIEVIRLSARFVKFLDPRIVLEIVEDNNKNRDVWVKGLESRSISPEIYLWENSPCAFPGVRRYAGSKEIAFFRNHTHLSEDQIHGALKLDDNDFPKQIWSFVFRERPFQKYGPKYHALAHLADHKEHNNRLLSEFEIEPNGIQHTLFGLYTCPTNTVYMPTSLLRPTDFSPVIRKLLIHKAHDLYGKFCNILPPWIKLDHEVDNKWNHINFEWADPVGTTENVGMFLDFRSDFMVSILAD